LVLAAGCKSHPPTAPSAVTLDSIARRYIRLAVALGEHDADSIDYYVGPKDWVADIRQTAPSLSEIRHSSNELIDTLQAMTMQDATSQTRKSFMIGQLQAIACRTASVAGQNASFDRESLCEFGYTSPKAIDEKALAATRAKISILIGGQGPLAERYNRYAAKYVIPTGHVKAVMARAIEGCRAQTRKRMSLPADEATTLELVGHEPWAGYSLYEGRDRSRISINLEFPVTVDRALDLACHEAYPGHHTWNMTQDDTLVKAGAIELLVQPTYSPQSFKSESAAAIASEMAFTPSERANFEREELFPLSGLTAPSLSEVQRSVEVEELVDRLHSAIAVIAREYLDGDLEFARAQVALEDEALMGNSFESLKYLNEFRSYIVTYTCGPDILNGYLSEAASTGADTEATRWRKYLHWMHTEPPLTPTVH
jgi:hypothetical protein